MINNISGNNTNNNMQQPMDPDTFAQKYADQKGITKEEAIEELKQKYGDPTQDGANAPQDLFNSVTKTDENSLVSTDLSTDFVDDSDKKVGAQKEQTEESKKVDKEEVINALVSEAGISKDEATEALKALGIEDGSEQVDPANKLSAFVEATGMTEAAAKAFLQEYVGEPQQK